MTLQPPTIELTPLSLTALSSSSLPINASRIYPEARSGQSPERALRLQRAVSRRIEQLDALRQEHQAPPSTPRYQVSILSLTDSSIRLIQQTSPFIINRIDSHTYQILMPYSLKDYTPDLIRDSLDKLWLAGKPGKFYFNISLVSIETATPELFNLLCEKLFRFSAGIYCSGIGNPAIDNSKIMERLKKIITSSDRLEFLDFSNAQPSAIESIIALLQICSTVTELQITNVDLTDEHIKSITERCPKFCKHLHAVNFSGCSKLTDTAFDSLFSACQNIQSVNAAECGISTQFLALLQKHKITLHTLYLDRVNQEKLNQQKVQQEQLQQEQLQQLQLQLNDLHLDTQQPSGRQQNYPSANEQTLHILDAADPLPLAQNNRHNLFQTGRRPFLTSDKQIIFDTLQTYIQTLFTNASVILDSDWLRFTIVPSAKSIFHADIEQILDKEIIAFIQKYKVSCDVDYSFFTLKKEHTLYRFIRELSPYLYELNCKNSHIKGTEQIDHWHFPKTEILNLAKCPITYEELQALFCPNLHTLYLKKCENVQIEHIPQLFRLFPKCTHIDIRGPLISYPALLSILSELPTTSHLEFSASALPTDECNSFTQQQQLQLLVALHSTAGSDCQPFKELLNKIVCTADTTATLLKIAYLHTIEDLQHKCQSWLGQNFWGLCQISYIDGLFHIHIQSLRTLYERRKESPIFKVIENLATAGPISLEITDDLIATYSFNEIMKILATHVANNTVAISYTRDKSENNGESFERFLSSPIVSTSIKKIHLNITKILHENSFELLAQKAPNLEEFSLQSCSFIAPDSLNYCLSLCKNLTTLSLCDCAVEDTTIESLCKSPLNLRKLSLSYCLLLTPRIISFISNAMQNLTDLCLEGCISIQDNALDPKFFVLPYLTRLNLNYTSVTDEALKLLSTNKREITTLNLNATSVTKTGLTHLGAPNLAQLETITLDECKGIDDDALAEIGRRMETLQHISICKNGTISSKGVLKLLQACDQLRTVKVDQCRNIPATVAFELATTTNNKTSLELFFSDEISEELLAILLLRYPYIKTLRLGQLAYASSEQIDQIIQFYEERALLQKQPFPIKTLYLSGFTKPINQELQKLNKAFDAISTLYLDGAITDKTLQEIPKFTALKRLVLKNSLCLLFSDTCTEESIKALTACKKIKFLHLEQIYDLNQTNLKTLFQEFRNLKSVFIVNCPEVSQGDIEGLFQSYPTLYIRFIASQSLLRRNKVDIEFCNS